MSGAHIRTNEVRKTIEPARQPGRELVRRQERGLGQAVAPQVAYRRVQLNRNGPRPADLLALQRAVGNRGVQRMLAKQVKDASNEQQAEATAEIVENKAQTKLSMNPLSSVVQRQLTVHNTPWNDATSMKASSGGGGGVLIISDGANTLAVKPQVRGIEEEIASWMHGQLPRSKKEKSWNLGSLDMRIAVADDVAGIRALQLAPNVQVTQSAKLNQLLQDLAPGTTMIQEFAPEGTRTFGEAMTQQVAAGGHLGENENAKTAKTSPLKPLLNKPDFAQSLGKVAAADILMGNFDRLVGEANLENFMVNLDTKRIFLIDNVGGQDIEQLSGTADPRGYFLGWSRHPFVEALKRGDVDTLVKSVWEFEAGEGTEDLGAKGPFPRVLVEGYRNEAGAALDFVAEEEKARLKAKLEERHLETIRENFQKGLIKGWIAITKTGGNLPPGVGNAEARQAFKARVLYLGGASADEAWPH
jgi:hypothetical protein